MLKLILLFVSCANALIIPEELPSLLSVAYSNIPPIKKGTDSRIGFGFSLGNHADFQVMFELGPQTNTNPIGTPYASSSKRQASYKPKKSIPNKDKLDDSDGSKYLSGWSQNMKQKKGGKPFLPIAIPEDNPKENPHGTVNLHDLLANMKQENMEIVLKQPSPSNIPAETLTQLKQLYGEKDVEKEATTKRPMFVPKRTSGSTTVNTAHIPKIPGNYERLAQFNVDEEEKNRKRRVTEDLSDVSLDDE